MKIILRVQGVEGSRFPVKGMEFKTLEPLKPGILEPYYQTKGGYENGGYCFVGSGFLQHHATVY